MDALRRMLEQANRRGDKSTYSALLSIVANQALATYDSSLGSHEAVSAALRWAPSLLLSSSRPRRGVEGFLLSPPVLAWRRGRGHRYLRPLHQRAQGGAQHHGHCAGPSRIGNRFSGTPVDGNGAPVTNATITWSSQSPDILGLNTDGTITSLKKGRTQVAATVGKLTVWTPVQVKASDAAAADAGGAGVGAGAGGGSRRLAAGHVMDPALWELLRAEAGTDGDRVLEAIIRLARPGIEIPDVRMVSRFGTIATCRIRARDVIAVRARPDVAQPQGAAHPQPGIRARPMPPPDPAGPAGPDRAPDRCPARARGSG